VVHGHHHIKFAGVAWRVARAHEHRVGCERTLHVHALRLGLCNHGLQHLDFFAAKKPPLTRVRIDPRHRDAWHSPQQLGQGLVGDLQGLHHLLWRDGIQRLTQRDMDAHQHRTQLVVGQHHAHRHLRQRDPGVTGALGLQKLGMTRVFVPGGARGMQRLLVQRRGHDSRHLAAQGRTRGPQNALTRQASGTRIDHPPRQLRRGRHHLQHRQLSGRHFQRLCGGVDALHAPGVRARQQGQRTAHHPGIACHKTTPRELRLLQPGVRNDFWPDAARVTGCDGDGAGWRVHQAGLSISMNSCASPSCAATWAATAGAP